MNTKFKNSKKITRQKIAVAFKNLRKKGFFARMNFKCCSSCALHEIDNDQFVFFHQQDNDSFRESGECMIRYGSTSYDANIIVKELESAGLNVKWDGNLNYAMTVS